MLLAESPPLQQAEERRADRARIVKTTKKSLAEFCPLANREIFNYTAADQTASFPPQFIHRSSPGPGNCPGDIRTRSADATRTAREWLQSGNRGRLVGFQSYPGDGHTGYYQNKKPLDPFCVGGTTALHKHLDGMILKPFEELFFV